MDNPIYIDPAPMSIPSEWTMLKQAGIFDYCAVLAGGGVLNRLMPHNADGNLPVVRDLDLFFIQSQYQDDMTPMMNEVEARVFRMGYKLKQTSPKGIVSTYELNRYRMPDIQIIRKVYPTVFKLFEAFDLHVCQFAFNGVSVLKTKKAKWNLHDMKVSVNCADRPVNTLQRLLKYQAKGFDCRAAVAQFLFLHTENIRKMISNADQYAEQDKQINALMEYIELATEEGMPVDTTRPVDPVEW